MWIQAQAFLHASSYLKQHHKIPFYSPISCQFQNFRTTTRRSQGVSDQICFLGDVVLTSIAQLSTQNRNIKNPDLKKKQQLQTCSWPIWQSKSWNSEKVCSVQLTMDPNALHWCNLLNTHHSHGLLGTCYLGASTKLFRPWWFLLHYFTLG